MPPHEYHVGVLESIRARSGLAQGVVVRDDPFAHRAGQEGAARHLHKLSQRGRCPCVGGPLAHDEERRPADAGEPRAVIPVVPFSTFPYLKQAAIFHQGGSI